MPFNFYELYNLINEDTVSQKIKKLRKENSLNTEKLLPIAYKEIKSILPNINDKSMRTLANWVLFRYLQGRDRGLFSDYLRRFALYVHAAYLSSQLDENGNWSAILNSKFNNINFGLGDLVDLDQEYHENLNKKQRNTPGMPGKTILSFPDGYEWINLEKKYCELEGKSMGHCGNAGAKEGDTILSLRDSKNIPHLTFVLNNGILGERKGRANTKPKKQYHPYIVELLKLPIIKGLGKGIYAPESDFQIVELSEEQIKELLKANPKMKISYYKSKLLSKEGNSANRTQDIINQDIPPDVLVELSDDEDYEVRQAVAMNKNTPIEIIIKLNNDTRDAGVIRGVCLNPNTPKEILLNHSEFSDISLALMLMFNPSLPKRGLFNIFNRFIKKINYAEVSPYTLSVLINRFLKRNDLPKEIEEKLATLPQAAVLYRNGGI